MTASLYRLAVSIALLGFATAQSSENPEADELSTAIESYEDLSLFRSLLGYAPGAFESAIANKTSNITVLIPKNEAISTYLNASGITDLSSVTADDLTTFFSYQVMVASLKSTDFEENPNGMVVPTLLTGDQYNNRSAGAQITEQYEGGAGQVVIASPPPKSTRRIKRQDGGASVTLTAGAGQQVEMETVDGSWGQDGVNTFQVVDSVLAPPRNCSTTFKILKDNKLQALNEGLVRTGLWPALDRSFNVTCLAPTTKAFNDSGNPQISLSKEDLSGAILAHTLTEVTYTSFLEDGMVLDTLNGTKVHVRIKNDEIYFNNAKIVQPNVLTNNGLIHVLDAVIQASDDDSDSSTTSTSTESPSSTSTSSSSSSTESNAAGMLSSGLSGVIAIAAAVMMM